MAGNYQPRGTSQTTTSGSWMYDKATSGDTALLQQNATYEQLSQQFVGSLSAVIKDGEDITNAVQKALLAIRIVLTPAAVTAYQPQATLIFWNNITDWLATYNAQIAYAKAQGWN